MIGPVGDPLTLLLRQMLWIEGVVLQAVVGRQKALFSCFPVRVTKSVVSGRLSLVGCQLSGARIADLLSLAKNTQLTEFFHVLDSTRPAGRC